MLGKKFLFGVIIFLFLFSLEGVPIAEKNDYRYKTAGIEINDPYHWMQDRLKPQVMDYILKENAYSDSAMISTQNLQNELFQEMNQYPEIKKKVQGIRFKKFTYYHDTDGAVDSLYRVDHKGIKHNILNLSYYKSKHNFVRMINYQYSPDFKYLAYLIDFTGNEVGTLFVLKVGESEDKADRLFGVSHMFFWDRLNQLFYVTRELPFKFQNIYIHNIKEDFSKDRLLISETSEKGSIDLYKSSDKLHFDVTRDTLIQAYMIRSDRKHTSYHPLMKERKQGSFYLYNNDVIVFIENNCLSLLNINSAKPDRIIKTLGHNTSLFDIKLCGQQLILFEEKEGAQKITNINLRTGQEFEVDFPEKTYTIYNASVDPLNNNILNFCYSSLNTPQISYRYYAQENKLELVEERILDKYNKELYQTDLIFVESRDKQSIPVSLVYRKDKFTGNGDNPLILRAYGAYSYSQFPGFDAYLLPMLDRGFVYAVAHVRGGSERGVQWYKEGIGNGKLNSINDYIAVSEALIKKGYTAQGRIAAFGRSAGGRLIASVINQRPDLFKCAILEVPACDGVNWLIERNNDYFNKSEFGDPEQKEAMDFYLQYDPYQAVKRQNYPALLITAGWNDNRVFYWQPLKLSAKIRDMKTDQNLLLMKTEIEAGHRGGSSADAYYLDWAYKYAFILKIFNLER